MSPVPANVGLGVGRTGDQEKLIDALAGDLMGFATDGVAPPGW